MVEPALESVSEGDRDAARRGVRRHVLWSGTWGLVLIFAVPPALLLVRDSSLLTRQVTFTAVCVVVVVAMLGHVLLAGRAITIDSGPVAEALTLRVRMQLGIALVLTMFAAARVVKAWAPSDEVDLVSSVVVLVIAVPASVAAFRLGARANRLDPPQRRR